MDNGIIKGVSFGFLAKNGYYRSEAGKLEIERICELGGGWVALIATVIQERYSDTCMYRDFEYTVSDLELAQTIETFRERGLKIMLKPMIECKDSSWRGRISFPEGDQQIQGIVTDYWGEWFKNYTRCMEHYAALAQDTGCEMLCIGCEMFGAEPMENYWPGVINSVREKYSGIVTYNSDQYFPDRPFMRKWFSLLDVLGISFYAGTERANPTPQEIAQDLQHMVRDIGKMSAELGVPVLFAECGARSVVNGAKVPWQFRNTGEYDGQVQADYLQGVIEAFTPCDWWKGLLWWKWDEQQKRPQYDQLSGNTGFTIYGKPAMEVMKKWCGE